MYENPWLYDGTPFDTVGEYAGFVYIITNKINNRKYIGKKNFWFTKTKQVKKKKKRIKVESDWQSYYGSNAELNADVEKFGKKNFERKILRLCKSKGEFGYFEAKFQFAYNALESDEYYNSWIMCKIHRKHLTFLTKKDKIS